MNGKSVRMMGVFDTQFIELPVSHILFRSPNLGCNLNLLIEVAVDRLPKVWDAIFINQLFHMFPQLNDIISQTRPRTVDADTSYMLKMSGRVALMHLLLRWRTVLSRSQVKVSHGNTPQKHGRETAR